MMSAVTENNVYFSEYTGIYDYYSNINDKIQIKVYKDQPPQNGEG